MDSIAKMKKPLTLICLNCKRQFRTFEKYDVKSKFVSKETKEAIYENIDNCFVCRKGAY